MIDGQVLNENINSIKTMITDGTATPEDIKEGKTAYVNGEKLIGSMNLAWQMIEYYRDNNYKCDYMFYYSKIAKLLNNIKTDCFDFEFSATEEEYDIGSFLFSGSNITKIPPVKLTPTIKSLPETIRYSQLFYNCAELEEIELIYPVVSHQNVMSFTFSNCSNLKKIKLSPYPFLSNNFNETYNPDGSIKWHGDENVQYYFFNYRDSFNNCEKLETIEGDLKLGTSNSYPNVFRGCKNLKNLHFEVVYQNGHSVVYAQGDGTNVNDYGTMLTVESLLSFCQAFLMHDMSITIGTANLNKLKNIYVKKLPKGEPDYNGYIWDKQYNAMVPFKVCESTDEGAMTIIEYMALRNNTLL